MISTTACAASSRCHSFVPRLVRRTFNSLWLATVSLSNSSIGLVIKSLAYSLCPHIELSERTKEVLDE